MQLFEVFCALVLDGFLCVCHACCRRKCVLLSESEARYTSTASVDCVSGFCHALTRKKQAPGEFNAASSDSFAALDRTEGSPAWFHWGVPSPKCLPWPLSARSPDRVIGPGPWAANGEAG